MPRKKTTQPPPLDSFVVDGITFEVRDETCEEVGRGMHTVAAHNKIFSKILTELSEEYFWGTPSQKSHLKDCFRSNHALAIELEKRKVPREFRSLVNLAQEIRNEFQRLESAIADIKKS